MDHSLISKWFLLNPSTGSRQALVQQHAEHIGVAQPQVGLGSLGLGRVGVQAAEQLFRHPEGEDA
jgi:hypothetical protein